MRLQIRQHGRVLCSASMAVLASRSRITRSHAGKFARDENTEHVADHGGDPHSQLSGDTAHQIYQRRRARSLSREGGKGTSSATYAIRSELAQRTWFVIVCVSTCETPSIFLSFSRNSASGGWPASSHGPKVSSGTWSGLG